jgi:hypothetical protein
LPDRVPSKVLFSGSIKGQLSGPGRRAVRKNSSFVDVVDVHELIGFVGTYKELNHSFLVFAPLPLCVQPLLFSAC